LIIAWRAWAIDIPEQRRIVIYSSDNVAWDMLPKDGILAIVLYEEEKRPDGLPKRRIMTGTDYYFRAVGREGQDIYGTDNDARERDVPADIAGRYIGSQVLRGVWTDDVTFAAVQREISNAVNL